MILPYRNIHPKIHSSVLIAEGAFIVGDVEIGKDSSIWFNTVVRGDVNYIRVGERTNIQDLTMVHVTYKKFPTFIGNDVSIGHSAVIHGCRIKDHVVIGMGAKILDDSTVSSFSLVAAGSVVKEKFVVPEGTLVAGVPAKVVRDLLPEEIERIKQNAKNYLFYVEQYKTYNKGLGFQNFETVDK
jgi:carbonic anhydrase/acetyltransferase-like protein (isoleucine patch superfamily)